MRANDYAKLEKDPDFKRDYLKKTLWWKNILIIAPVCLLFGGLVGILFLFKNDMLASWYIVPYLALFVVGTVLLKAIKKHIQKTMMTAEGAFHVCLAKPIGEKDGYVYTAFVNDNRRHEKQYIINLIKDVSLDDILSKNDAPFRKKAVLIKDNEIGTDLYIRAYFNKDITKYNVSWREDDLVPVLYINEKNTPVIKKKHLNG